MLTVGQLALAAINRGAESLGKEGMLNRPIKGLVQVMELKDPLALKGEDIFLITQVENLTDEGFSLLSRASAKGYAGMAIRIASCPPEVVSLLETEAVRLNFPILLLPITMTLWEFQNWVYSKFPGKILDPLLAPAGLITSGFWQDEALSY